MSHSRGNGTAKTLVVRGFVSEMSRRCLVDVSLGFADSLSAAFSLSPSGAAGIPASGIPQVAGGFVDHAICTSPPRRIRHREPLRFALRRTLHQLRSIEGYT